MHRMSQRSFDRGSARWAGGSATQWSARDARPMDAATQRDLSLASECAARLAAEVTAKCASGAPYHAAEGVRRFVDAIAGDLRRSQRPLSPNQRAALERTCVRLGIHVPPIPASPAARFEIDDGYAKPLRPPGR